MQSERLQFDSKKIRLIVLTDISSLEAGVGEPDDTQSLVRLLLYSNELDIEGLIATYTEHGKGAVRVDYLAEIVRQYGKVQANLKKHSAAYPEAGRLMECIKAGSPVCGLDRVGEGMDTEGSDWIIRVVDRPDTRSVWFAVWGGAVDLAQALWRVKKERGEAGFKAFSEKVKVYSILDQYDTAGPWIRENCPDVFYITSYLAFRGIYREGDQSLVSRQWADTHICSGHGPLGNAYPNYDGGDCWGPVKGVKEGDTPSFLYLIPNGPGNPDHPDWGGWGGRFEGTGNRYVDVSDKAGGAMASVYRWRQAYQNSFQARMDWCVAAYEEANHEPAAAVETGYEMEAGPGDTVRLSAEGSYDPDGDTLHYQWMVCREAGSYRGELELSGEREQEAAVKIPKSAGEGTVHLLLSVTDDGEPPLTSYRRVILKIRGRE